MKKKSIAILVIVCLLALLFVPLPLGSLEDGGTRVYAALTYKLVCWNRLQSVYDESGAMTGVTYYRHTSVFWLPDHLAPIDTLWTLEQSRAAK